MRTRSKLTISEYNNYEFYRKSPEFQSSYLGSRNKEIYLNFLNRKYYILARNKYLTHLFLKESKIPTTDLLLYYNPESVVISEKMSNDCISTADALKKIPSAPIVVKPTESFHGDGVMVIHDKWEDENKNYLLRKFNGEEVLLDELLGKVPLIFEAAITQTTQFNNFNHLSVNTLRFITCLYPDHQARIISVYLRIGRKGVCTDNARDGGNINAKIDIHTGKIMKVFQFDSYHHIKEITHHPDSGTQISGMLIDNWKEITNRIINYQKRIPYIKAIGWDVAITNEGPVVIEINDYWDGTGQLFTEKGWANEVEACYEAWNKIKI